MKAFLLLLMAPIMLVFTVGALQTMEWCMERGYPIPIAVYILLIVVAIWGLCTVQCSKEDLEKANDKLGKWIESLLK